MTSSQNRSLRAVALRKSKRHQLQLNLERLEPRNLLAGDLESPWAWFESFDDVPRISPAELSFNRTPTNDQIGPHDLVASEWIVQLNDAAIESLSGLRAANDLIDSGPVDFSVIAGLGTTGSLLLRGRGPSDADVMAALEHSDQILSFHANSLIEGQAIPNDNEFAAGLLPGLGRIEAPTAWDTSTGSTAITVGVVDSGIDATHQDLYLNVWLNQGEIPDAINAQLTDIDGDGLITFYDLNNLQVTASGIEVASTGVLATQAELTTATPFAAGANAAVVTDVNGNGRIDAVDLLDDVDWADGRDTDGNSFFDDLFGVNFRSGNDDPFASNRPLDELGHGTHVSGTIGAIGNNGVGVVGVNWQSSLMSLRILDNNNQADASAAIRAVNYAKQMQADLTIDDSGRVVAGTNVRVLNNSWGQPGGFDQALETAIRDSGEEGILFVAAAGNGNILGNGVNNDATPFYPASYELENVIGVSALSSDGTGLATFSNFGATSIDIAAPGVGVRSTLPGGGFGPANGTSMAAPHVSGVAALIFASLPDATTTEVRSAILDTATPFVDLGGVVSTGGRLNAEAAINADVFAPSARIIAKQDVTTAGGTETEFTVQYSHRNGIDPASLGDDDITVTRTWGSTDALAATLKPGSVVDAGTTVNATYILQAPGGSWDVLDFGEYLVSTNEDSVANSSVTSLVEGRGVGSFMVRINDPSVIYVDTFADAPGENSLRDAIIAANASTASRTIILDSGIFTIDIPSVADSASTFPGPPDCACVPDPASLEFSDETTGDFLVKGNVTVFGNQSDSTIVDARALDRVFRVDSGGSLSLNRLTVSGGLVTDNNGGGILSVGTLNLDDVIVRNNFAVASVAETNVFGGGIASWAGTTNIADSWFTENESIFGGAVFLAGDAGGNVQASTFSSNVGGAFHSHASVAATIGNSTFSGNRGGNGAIHHGYRDFIGAVVISPVVSGDGQYVAHLETSSLGSFGVLYHVSTNARTIFSDVAVSSIDLNTDGRFVTYSAFVDGFDRVFVFDRVTQTTELISVDQTGGDQVDGNSSNPSISNDGRFVAFQSDASNLVANDTIGTDVFVYDRQALTMRRVSVDAAGLQANDISYSPDISGDGNSVAFASNASNLIVGDTNNGADVFVYHLPTSTIERVSQGIDSALPDNILIPLSENLEPTISDDGRVVAFSTTVELVGGDTNGLNDVYYNDRDGKSFIASVNQVSDLGDGPSDSPELSADGSFVAFRSFATNFATNDTNGASDIFVTATRFGATFPFASISQVSLGGGGFLNPDGASSSPSWTDDNSALVYASTSANVGGDSDSRTDIYSAPLGNQLNSVFTVVAPTVSPPKTPFLNASQVTIAQTVVTEFAVRGRVLLGDALLTQNSVFNDFSGSVFASGTVLGSVDIGSDLIGPLTQFDGRPPVHPVLQGNPAIDAGSPALAGTVDQRGILRTIPDIGAFEVSAASLAGTVFVDLNRNQVLDFGEPGLADVVVTAETGPISGTQAVLTQRELRETFGIEELGDFNFDGLPAGETLIKVAVPTGFVPSVAPIRAVQNQSLLNDSDSDLSPPAISRDGRFVAIGSNSSNFVAGDTNGVSDVFLFDTVLETITRISVAADGTEGNGASGEPSMSEDGRYIVFSSEASNLVPNDSNNEEDVFLYDRITGTLERVNLKSDGSEPNDGASAARISSDGSTVVYESRATDLDPTALDPDTGTPNNIHVFAYNRLSGTTEKVTRYTDGTPFNSHSETPDVSADGRIVAVHSRAFGITPGVGGLIRGIYAIDRVTNEIQTASFVPGIFPTSSFSPAVSDDGRFIVFETSGELDPNFDYTGRANSASPIYIYDRVEGSVELVSRNEAGIVGNFGGRNSALSGDGRFVVYQSNSSNLIEFDSNGIVPDTYVFDRISGRTAKVNVDADGQQDPAMGLGAIEPSISADGRLIAFHSDSKGLVPSEQILAFGVSAYVAPNPLIEPGDVFDLALGQSQTGVNIGLFPIAGSLSGRLFHDSVENLVFDQGEEVLEGWTVYLDSNQNRQLDASETSTLTDADGNYSFELVPSFQSHRIAAVAPAGWEQFAPGPNEDFVWDVFLNPDGAINGRDFAFRRVQGTGQSSSSSVSGRIFDDKNDNGVWDAGIDVPLTNTVVYLDQQNFGVRDINEPAVQTDANGIYTISDLGSSVVAVSTVLEQTTLHASPLGSDFVVETFPLFDEVQPFGNPQAIVEGDFNNDSFPDVAVALGEANKISIRLNDGAGGFLPNEIDVELGADGGGPTSLVVGHFNAGNALDVAVTNNFNSNVMILLDFNGADFASKLAVPVGQEPLDIAAANLDGDSDLDLVVVNQFDRTVQALLNDGAGTFTAQTAVNTGGDAPAAIVAGQLTGSSAVDVAVVHVFPSGSTPFGDVRILAGDGSGGFSLTPDRYEVGATPTDLVAANFDNDPGGRLDLAVANFSSNSVSILTGNADGTFTVQAETLGTSSGAFDIAAADIDNDGDIDIAASNLLDRNISIFRNTTVTPGVTTFEPLEGVALGQFGLAQRMPLVLANFDQDTSAPGGEGTIDIVSIPRLTDTLHVLTNTLVDGAHRVALTGLNQVAGLNFIVTPATLDPSLDPIANPSPIVEDSSQQSVVLSGIAKGRVAGPALQFVATSSNPSLIPHPSVNHVDGSATGTLLFTPVANANGQATISVTVTDAGADALHGTADDASFTQQFVVTVLPVNDPPAFVVPSSLDVNEDAGAQTHGSFVTGIATGGGSDETGQLLNPFAVSTSDSSFFTVQPAINAAGQLTFTPAANASGTVTVNVSLTDNGGTSNGGLNQTAKAFVVNLLPVNDAPSITIGGNLTGHENSGQQTVANFANGFVRGGGTDEASQTISDFVISNDNNSLFAVQPDISNDGTLTYTPAAVANGTANVTVQVRDSGGTARGGVDISLQHSFVIQITTTPDTTAPVPIITTNEPDPTNKNTFDVFVDFGEVVTGFAASDVSAPGATVGAPVDLSNGLYRVPITKPTDGSVTIGVAANVANDLAGNANVVALPLSISVDSTALVPSLTTTAVSPIANMSFDVTIDFGETVTGFLASNLTVVNGTASNLAGGAGGVYTATIDASSDGPVTVVVPTGAAKDVANNDSLASAPLTVVVDTIVPAPALSSVASALTNQSTFIVEVDFMEPVTGFALDDVLLSSGTVDDLTDLDDGRYTIRVNDAADGPFSLSLRAAAAMDSAGNQSLLASGFQRTIDTTPPQPLVTTSEASPTANSLLQFQVAFGEQVADFVAGDLTVIGATIDSFVDNGGGQFAVILNPTSDGQVTLIVPSFAAQDLAGNDSLSSTPVVLQVDRSNPLPTISSPVGSATNQSTFDVEIDFGEEVTGFTSADITITPQGATIGTLTHQGDGLYVVPITTTTDGVVTIGVGASVASDLAGNVSLAAVPLEVTVDSAALIPVVSTTAPNPTTNSTFDVTIDFGEVVTGFAANDLTLINATASNLRDNGNGLFTVQIDAIADGLVTLVVPSRAAQDLAGNDSTASAQLNRLVDQTRPAPVISSLVDGLTNRSAFDVEIDFVESVSGFTATDLSLSSGSVESLTDLGNGRFLARVANLVDGNFTIGLAANSAVDVAGNTNVAAAEFSRTIDTTAPQPLLTSSELSPTTSSTFTVVVDFGETVTGFSATDVSVVGGTIPNLVDDGNGRYIVTINAVPNGLVNLVVPSLGARDLADNPSLASNTLEIRVDSIPPLPVISSRVGSLSNQLTFDVDVDFGEPVNGFSVTDITAPGATLGTLVNLGGGRYTVPITRATDGSVTIGIASGVAADNAGSLNLAAAPITVTIDSEALVPVVTTAVSNPSANNVFDVSIDFGETVSGFVANDLALTGATVTNLRDDGGGRFTVTLTAGVDGQVSLVVPSRAAQDAAGNDSLPSAPLIVLVDTTPPSPSVTSLVSPLTNEDTFNVEVDFGEPVFGFAASDLTLSSGQVENVTDLGLGRFLVRLSNLADGPFTLGLAADAAIDASGNNSLAAANLVRQIDTTAARPVLNTTESNPTVNSTFAVDIDFGEAINGLAAGDITVINATVTALVDNGNGRYSATISSLADGQVTVIVPSLAAQDLAGNPSLASVPLILDVDTTSPTPILETSFGSLSNQTTFNVSLDFGETVTGFSASDVTAPGAIVGVPIDEGNGRFTIPITKTTDGTVTIGVAENAVSDIAGNQSVAAASLAVTVDSAALVPDLSTSETNPTSNGTFDVSIDFGEPVTGLLESDFAIVNGSVLGLSDVGNGRFTATILANADGLVTVIVPGNAAQDSAGNDSLASAPLSLVVDTTSPAPVIGSLVSALINQSAFNVEIDFGEPVTGFDANDLTLSSGVVESLASLGAGRFQVRVGNLADGVFTLALATAAANDLAGNASEATPDFVRTIDTTVPQPSLSTIEPSPTTNLTFDVQVDFGEPVSGFVAGDLAVVGGTVANLQDDGNGTFTVSIAASGDGNVNVVVPSLVAQDAAGNRTLASLPLDVRVDTAPPNVTLTSLDGALTNQSTFNIEVDFGEPIFGFSAADVTAPGTTIGTPIDQGNGRFIVPITKPSDGQVTISVPAGVVNDAAGNANPASSSLIVSVDLAALVPVVTTAESNPTANSSFDVTVDFGEPVVGFSISDLALVNATASNLRDDGGGQFTVAIAAIEDGPVSLIVPSRAAQDSAGNDSLASSPLSLDVDTTSPIPTIGSLTSSLTNQSTFNIEVDFGESVTGFQASELVLTSGTVENLTDLGDGLFLARVAGISDGVFTIDLPAGAAVDQVGNLSEDAVGLTRTVDATSPRPTVATSEPNPTTNADFQITVDFAESVTGFGASDLSVVGGTISSLQDIGNGRFTATVNADADGAISVVVPSLVAQDAAGNRSLASVPLELAVDTTPPTPQLTSEVGNLSNELTFNVVVDFGETVLGFTSADVSAPGATVGNPTDEGNGRFVVPISVPNDGPVTVNVGGGAANDAAGNASLPSAQLSVTVDTTALVPVVSTAEASPTANQTFDVSIDFGETVTGFVESDLALINATVVNLRDDSNGRFTVTLQAVSDGQVTLIVPSRAAQDAANNDSQASAPLSLIVDSVSPLPTISSLSSALTNQSTFNVEIDFAEAVNGFDANDLVLSSGMVENLTDLGQGKFNVRLANVNDGTFTVGLGAGVATDQAGNPSLAAVDLVRTVDTGLPLPSLSSSEPSPTVNSMFDVTIDFGEPVFGFVAGDVAVTGGTIASLQDDGNGRFTADFVANGDGEVNIAIPSLAAQDAAGNRTLGSSLLSIEVDATAPLPSIRSQVGTLSNQSTFNVEVDFGEPVVGFDVSDISAGSASVGALIDQGNGLFVVPITQTAGGPVTIQVGANVAVDDAGNPNVAASSLVVTVDNAALVPILSTSEPNPTRNSDFEVMVDFGEPVNGFVSSDIVVTGATVTNLQDNGNGRFTANIQSIADGQVSIVVPNRAAQDAAGNDSVASAPLARLVDSTSPTPIFNSLADLLTNQSTFNVEVDFGEPVLGFQSSDLVLSSGTVESLTDLGDGQFLARISGASEGSFVVSLPADVATDVAGNSSLDAMDLTRTIDLTIPVPTLSTTEPNPTVSQSFQVTVDFGEPVQGFEIADVAIVGATVNSLVDNGSGRYTLSIGAVGDGQVSLLVPSLAADDAANNKSLSSAPLILVVDSTAPTPTLSSLVGSLSNQSTFNVQVDFGEPVIGFEAADISAPDALVGNPIDQGGGRFIVPITRSTDGFISISIGADVVTDQAANLNLASSTLGVTVDRTALVPVVNTIEPNPTSNSSFDVSVNFGEPVAGFVISDLALINATASNLQDLGNGQFLVTVSAVDDGQVTLIVPGGSAQDNAGNNSLASTPLGIRVDTTAPTPLTSSLATSLINQSVFNVEVDFGESVIGFDSSDLLLTSGTVENLSDLGGGRYMLRIGDAADGLFTISVPANSAVDEAGNASLAGADLTRTIDTEVPLPSLSANEPSPTTNSSFTATIDFGELVVGFTSADITTTGGSVTNLRDDGDGRYTVTIGADSDGPVTVSVPSLVAQDPAGNRSLPSNVLNIDVDTAAPSTSLRSLVGDLSNQSTFNVEVDFGEEVIGFEAADVSAPGATVGEPIDTGSGKFIVPITKPTDGSVTISIAAGVVVDTAGNSNLASGSVQVNVDSSALVPVVSTSEPDPTSNTSFEVSIDFGETVNALALNDFTLNNATASNLQDLGDGRFVVTITAVADGQVGLVVPSGAAQDVAGNDSLASLPLSLRVDTTAPTAAITSSVPALTSQSAFEVEVDFGESVFGFDASDLVLSSGAVESLSDQGDGRFVVRLGEIADGPFTLGLPTSVATDEAGNESLAATTFTREVDATFAAPLLTTSEPNPTSNGSFEVEVDFGETVIGFTSSDLAVVGATVNDLVDNGNGRFTATIQASDDGQVTLFVPAGVASDQAGNDTLASTILNLVVDTTSPLPLLRLFSSGANQSTFDVEIDFGEPVIGFAISDLTLSSGAVDNLADLGSGRFLARIANANDGPFTLSLAAGAATDEVGNISLAAADLNRTTDTVSPLPVLSSLESNPTVNQSFVVTVDFGEPVDGLASDDISVVNGTVTNVVSIDGQSFAVDVTADSNGPVTIDVLAGATSDLAGNVSLRSQPFVLLFDAVAPAPQITTDQPSTTGLTTFTIVIDFGETVEGFVSADLNLTNATAGLEADLGQGRFEVDVTAISDGAVTIGLPAGAAIDGAGRSSLAAQDLQIVVDSQGFNALLSTSEPSPTNNATFNVLVDFGKDVSGFEANDLQIVNGVAGQVAQQGAGSFLVPVTANNDGAVTVSVPGNAVVDGTNRGNLPSATLSIEVDRIAPTPILSTTVTNPTSRSQFDVAIDFGEPVIGFDSSDIQVIGGSAGELREFGNGLFLVPIQPFGDGTLAIDIPAGVVTDEALNANVSASTLSISVDRTAPQATLSTSEPNPTNNLSFEVEIDFGEMVTGFELDDLQIVGGVARDLVDVTGGRFTVTIDAQPDTNVSIDLPADVVLDAVDNPNVASVPLEIMVLDDSPRDFGDAPSAVQSGFASSYHTLLEENGPTHVVSDLFLGAAVSAESFGQPSPDADADADDGIRFHVTAVASATTETISSLVLEASDSGFVDGWIDYNQDGDWSDPGEQVFASTSVTGGTNLLPFNIPAGALSGETYARFRLSSTGGLAPTGPATDGEVEDYLVTLADAAVRPEIVAQTDAVDSLEVVVTDTEVQLVSENIILAQAAKSATSGVTIQAANGDTVTRIGSSSMSAGRLSVALASGRSVLQLSADQILDLTTLASSALEGIDEIDLTEGNHELILNVEQVTRFAESGLRIVFDLQDVISVGDGWEVEDVQIDNGRFLRRIIQQGAIVSFDGPDDYTNPIDVFDVNQSGAVTANDALNVINELARGQFTAADGSILDPSGVDLTGFRFYDVTRDLRITALDALRIINELARTLTAAEAEAPIQASTLPTDNRSLAVDSQQDDLHATPKLVDVTASSVVESNNLEIESAENSDLEAESVDYLMADLSLLSD